MKRSTKAVLAVLFGVFALLTGGSVVASAAPAAEQQVSYERFGPFELRNFNSGKCLEAPDWSTANGARMQQWTCVGANSQKWWYDVVISGEVQIIQLVNVHSGKCLEVADWRTDNGAPVQQWDCAGIPSQRWINYGTCWTCEDPGSRLVNEHSGKLLEIEDSYTYNGARAQQWDGAGVRTQVWFFR
ncbi:RICIN domain-containing protein [Actinokineospora soli]|uniref:RICIN domain-containing protein n=1 Tax=Actinokineospora soli TaxID=1048753 RepID=A0ABW2TR91_9PSEU